VSFTPWGGAYNRVPADATAFPHRDALFVVQHLVTVSPDAATTERDAARGWLARSWALVHPWGDQPAQEQVDEGQQHGSSLLWTKARSYKGAAHCHDPYPALPSALTLP
jgi:hypothetical protein